MNANVTPNRADSVRLVPFLFGVAGRDELPGVVLVGLLEILGLSRPAARGLIARMRTAGLLAARPRGRGSLYRLAGDFAAAFHRIRAGEAGAPQAWDGVFHTVLYRVPETERAFRDRLRRYAVFTGYGNLQSGVLICPTDRRESLARALRDVPEGATMYFGRLELAPADAARAAFEAWSLDDLNRLYLAHTARLRRAVDRLAEPPPASGETLRTFTELLCPVFVDLLRTPALPAELFPSDWSMSALGVAIGQVQQAFGPPAAAFVDQAQLDLTA